MKRKILAGTTSFAVKVFVQDTTSTTGAGLTGLVYNSAGLTAYYIRNGASSPTAITLATATVGTWTSGGFVEVSAANLPGVYELGIPDAALAAGAVGCVLMLKGAANMAPVLLEIELDAVNYQDSAAFGLSRLDTNIGSRSTYAGGAVASVTGNVGGNVAGSVASVTADVGITQAAADKVWGSAARTLTGFGTLVADVAAAVWGAASRTLSAFGFGVTVTTNSDKTGYSLAGSEHTAIATDTQTGLTAQGYTSARAVLLSNLDAAISTRLAASGYTAPPGLSAIINGVLDELLSSHTGAGSVGAGIAAAGAAGDPWATALPGGYTEGQAGYTIGHNLDVPVSTRAGAGASVTTTGPVLAGGGIALVAGDTYQTERGTALQWTYTGPVDVLTSPAPDVTFTIPTQPTPLSVPVTVGGTPGAITLTAEMSAAESAALPAGGAYPYSVFATWTDPDTDRVTLVRGTVRVHA
jgi:hypothetical protein